MLSPPKLSIWLLVPVCKSLVAEQIGKGVASELRRMSTKQEADLSYIPTDGMVDNVLTKAPELEKYKLMMGMGIRN